MQNEITMTANEHMISELLINFRRNYPSLGNPFELRLQAPERILFYGSDSDVNSATIFYSDAQLHLFHRKNRSWLDASFLEQTNTACLYDTKGNKPLAGIKLFRGDRGEVELTTAYESENVIPYLAFPALLNNLSFKLECPGYPSERVNKVTGTILGCLETPAVMILNSLVHPEWVKERKESSDFMDKVSLHSIPLQEFVIKR